MLQPTRVTMPEIELRHYIYATTQCTVSAGLLAMQNGAVHCSKGKTKQGKLYQSTLTHRTKKNGRRSTRFKNNNDFKTQPNSAASPSASASGSPSSNFSEIKPALPRNNCSISFANAGFSRKVVLAFSRPCPKRCEL